jgi:hypothetical protein
MPTNIPDGITRDHIIEAIRQYSGGVDHRFADSTGYDLLFEGNRYPPKAIVGITARLVTGEEYGPDDFSGGRGSKCFGILQRCGFEIVEKSLTGTWLFQGNPSRFDIDDYVSRYSYVYWSAPRGRASMALGDRCVLWRAGRDAGAIATGRIAELPTRKDEVRLPDSLGDDLWRHDADSPDDFKVGIEVDEYRLDEDAEFVPRSALLANPVLASSTIIKMPNGTVFRFSEEETREFWLLWRGDAAPSSDRAYEAVEGTRRLRQHYARERCRTLIEKKRADFARRNDGRVFCEVCRFDFATQYPSRLGEGFIEVHHLSPLSTQDEPRKTTLDDLLLVCANCHRMIHRTKDADGNLAELREHFGERPYGSDSG